MENKEEIIKNIESLVHGEVIYAESDGEGGYDCSDCLKIFVEDYYSQAIKEKYLVGVTRAGEEVNLIVSKDDYVDEDDVDYVTLDQIPYEEVLEAVYEDVQSHALNESKLSKIVTESIERHLNEIMGKATGSLSARYDNASVYEGQPETWEDVLKGDHIKLVAQKQMGNVLRIGVIPEYRAYTKHEPFQYDKGLEDELNLVLNKQGKKATYKGRMRKYKGVQVYDIE